MAFLFQKFQEAVRTLAKSPTFAKDPRHIQFEADINRLFLYTSYNRLGKDAVEQDAEEIIDLAGNTSLADQQTQVQENVHSQIKSYCKWMDEALQPDLTSIADSAKPTSLRNRVQSRSGLSLAVGGAASSVNKRAIPDTKPLKQAELSEKMKDLSGFTLKLKPSLIPHQEAGRGLFIDGEADVGAVIAIYPGIVYSPAYYRYIPGYPRVDKHNPYLITRYDGTVINAQPWGVGGDTREVWDVSRSVGSMPNTQEADKGTDRIWKMLSKPLPATRGVSSGDVLERRNPFALAHFANHPNLQFGSAEEVKMRRFGSFWFKSRGSGENASNVPCLKSLVLVATRALSDEEVLLNYRLSNSKRRPSWYTPVDEEEDRRRWS